MRYEMDYELDNVFCELDQKELAGLIVAPLTYFHLELCIDGNYREVNTEITRDLEGILVRSIKFDGPIIVTGFQFLYKDKIVAAHEFEQIIRLGDFYVFSYRVEFQL